MTSLYFCLLMFQQFVICFFDVIVIVNLNTSVFGAKSLLGTFLQKTSFEIIQNYFSSVKKTF